MTGSANIVWCKLMFILLALGTTAMSSRAQTDVEIEIAGPWSYVADPMHSDRIVIVAPVGHVMAVFTGSDITQYPGTPGVQTLGHHHLDFAVFPCGPMPSSFYLYPANGVSPQTIQSALSSPSTYSLSLPKPCSYESKTESVFKYHGVKPITGSDPERSLTTVMTLHYQVPSSAPTAVMDNATLTPIPFGIGGPKAISVVLFLDLDPDRVCDSHSRVAFDATLALWGLPQVYRLFPQLKYNDGDKYNEQTPGSYGPSCPSTPGGSPLTVPDSGQAKVEPHKQAAASSRRAPGRADCHAAQVNVNGAVN
jgi:hypothetical protein